MKRRKNFIRIKDIEEMAAILRKPDDGCYCECDDPVICSCFTSCYAGKMEQGAEMLEKLAPLIKRLRTELNSTKHKVKFLADSIREIEAQGYW